MIEKLTQNNKFTTSNKVKTIITLVISLILVTIGTVAAYPILDTNTRFEEVKNGYDNDVFYGIRQCLYKGGYANFVEGSSQQELYLSNFNFINPTYVIIREFDGKKYTDSVIFQDLSFIKFQRTGITSFEPIEEYGVSIRNKTLSETIEIIKKYDLLKENPDPKNITVVPPKSPEELAKIAEQYCNQIEAENENKKLEENFEKASPAEKIKILEESIADLQKRISESDSPENNERTLKVIEVLKTEMDEIKQENGIE